MGWVIIIISDGGCGFWQLTGGLTARVDLAWADRRRPLGAVPYSSYEPGELSQWLWASMTAPSILSAQLLLLLLLLVAFVHAFYVCKLRWQAGSLFPAVVAIKVMQLTSGCVCLSVSVSDSSMVQTICSSTICQEFTAKRFVLRPFITPDSRFPGAIPGYIAFRLVPEHKRLGIIVLLLNVIFLWLFDFKFDLCFDFTWAGIRLQVQRPDHYITKPHKHKLWNIQLQHSFLHFQWHKLTIVT